MCYDTVSAVYNRIMRGKWKKVHMKDKIRKHKNLLIKIAVAMLCMLLLVGLVIVQYVHRTFSTYRIAKEEQLTGTTERYTLKMGDHLLVYSHDGMRCMNAKGKTIWDVTYQMQKPCAVTSGNMAAVAGFGDSLIYIMDETGQIGEINTKLPIRNLCVSEAGYVGAVLDDNDVYWVYIYDTDGQEISKARTTMEQSGYPISLSLSSNGKLLGIVYLYLDAGVLESRVTFYNLGEVGQNYTDHFMGSFKYEELVSELHYMNSTVAIGISDSRLMFYTGSEKPTVLKEIFLPDTLESVYWGTDSVVLVYHGTAEQGRYFMQVYDLSGNLTMEKGFDLEYTGITSQNGIVTIYNSDEVFVYTLDGRQRYHGDLGGGIRAIVSTNVKYKYLVLFDEMFKVIELE